MDIRHTRDVDLVFRQASRLSAPGDGRHLTEDLVLAITSAGRYGESVAGRALQECGLSRELVQASFGRRLAMPGVRVPADAAAGLDQPGTTDDEQAAAAARAVANELGQRFFGTEHLLLALIQDDRCGAAGVLRGLGVDPQLLAERLVRLAPAAEVSDYALLDRFGRDLVAEIHSTASPPPPGEDWQLEIDRVIHVAARMTKNTALVFGPPPADPGAVILGLARAIASGELADRLACERLYDVDMQAVLAASPNGDALRRAVRAIGLAARNRGNVLLCIAGIDRYLRRGAEAGDFDTEEALRIGIAQGYLQVLGTMTNPAAAQEILSSPVINRRTQLVQVPAGGTSPRTVEHTNLVPGG